MPDDKAYLVAQERTTVVKALNPSQARSFGEQVFNAYTISDNPGIREVATTVRKTLYENLPMYLNLADSKTVIGKAKVHRDVETGAFSITIEMGASETALMDHLVEICDLRAIGFAGYLKENVVVQPEKVQAVKEFGPPVDRGTDG